MLMVLLALLVAPSLQATEKRKGDISPPVPARAPSLTSDPSPPSYPSRFLQRSSSRRHLTRPMPRLYTGSREREEEVGEMNINRDRGGRGEGERSLGGIEWGRGDVKDHYAPRGSAGRRTHVASHTMWIAREATDEDSNTCKTCRRIFARLARVGSLVQ
jgi:hypothetical protein